MKPYPIAAFAAFAALVFALPASAANPRAATFAWDCNIEGAPARLSAQVEAVTPAGVFVDANGLFAGAISTGEVNYYYEGNLVSATARYVFTGENQFADFTDLNTNDRFHVQFIVSGRDLLMIANPHGPQPAQYGCTMVGPAQ